MAITTGHGTGEANNISLVFDFYSKNYCLKSSIERKNLVQDKAK